ncbi:MAG: hypothetical protein GXO16_05420 [Epsilonproteobacteria bacterium]|nr:hypothetical protein [Campylobacterota bacterium]
MHEKSRVYLGVYHRWRRYRLKRFIFFLVTGSAAAILLALPFVMEKELFSWKKLFGSQKQKSAPPSPKSVPTMLPDKSFEELLETKAQKIRSFEPKRVHTPPPPPKPKRRVAKPAPKPKPKKKIFIKKSSIDIGKIIAGYNRAPSLGKALFIARYYYKKGEYQKAMQWAVKANEHDSSNEESWLIYAKSLAHLGKKDEAMRALKIFIKKSDSREARALLDLIAQGAFQ